MRYFLFISTAVIVLLAACNSNSADKNSGNAEANIKPATDTGLYACSMHPEVTGKKGEKCSKCGMELTEKVTEKPAAPPAAPADSSSTKTEPPVVNVKTVAQSKVSIEAIVASYLRLKNALVKDDGNAAASAGKALYASFNNVNIAALDEKVKKDFSEIADDSKEHSEHIGANASKIDHQREHFATLSKDVNDLIKMFGASQKLYQDFCPMYNDGKGAIWISETKEIKNPFYGSQMLSCGSLKKTY